jgi:hypothetical protein
LIVVVVLIVGVAATWSLRTIGDSPDPVAKSIAITNDDDRFSTARDASDALAEIGGRLAKIDCDVNRSNQCVRVRRATAWANVSAVLIVQCTPPLVYEARTGLRRYLEGHGELPPTPRCGARRPQSSSE